jgi:hypothetical protein
LRSSILFAWSFLALAGCTRTISFNLPRVETFDIYVYVGGRAAEHCQMLPDDAKFMALNNWLRSNAQGWTFTPNTYVPGVLVSGKTFSINFQRSAAILNYAGGEYSHVVDPSQYQYLVCSGRT